MRLDPHRETILEYDKVIIGSSIEAMATAFKYQIPIFCDLNNKPLPYMFIPHHVNLSTLNVENKSVKYKYLGGKEEMFGIQKLELWNILAYRLQLMGLMPFNGEYKNNFTESIPDGQKVGRFAIVSNGKYINISARKTILFDYPKYIKGKKILFVHDYIKVQGNYDMKKATIFRSEDCDFTNTNCYETIFYKEKGNKTVCCVKSIIDEKNIDQWRYSATAVRLKTEQDVFWNLDKNYRVSLYKREISPMLTKLCDNLNEIINLDAMDIEIYE